ncbi:hypothetical protein CASFOL_003895 [Castilleja foliolosa]|uniref:Homeobox-leucine zipper protein n=1 Tax=Castilleja foliolosa TaxID=1961234 RepID=A0ABD3EMC4_9LAMI
MSFFHTNFMLQTPHNEDDQIQSCNNPQEFHGSMLGKRSSMSFSTGIEDRTNINNHCHHEDDLSDDESKIGDKKKRLNTEQVRTLEKNFELGNKLEPERKIELARALGLQPRQIAIWFQNRRARWKTKQLEKDYEILRKQFEDVRAENDGLHSQNKKLHAEIVALKSREPTESINLNKETEDSCSNRSENSSEINKLDISRNYAIDTSTTVIANRSLFPSSRPDGVAQLFQDYSRPEIQGPQNVVKEESLCNMLSDMGDDQTGYWPWLDQHNFN